MSDTEINCDFGTRFGYGHNQCLWDVDFMQNKSMAPAEPADGPKVLGTEWRTGGAANRE